MVEARYPIVTLLLILLSIECRCYHIDEGQARSSWTDDDDSASEFPGGGGGFVLGDTVEGGSSAAPVRKRFMFHSNGDCPVFHVQCFSSRDCIMQYANYNYRCVMHRCSVTCHYMQPNRASSGAQVQSGGSVATAQAQAAVRK